MAKEIQCRSKYSGGAGNSGPKEEIIEAAASETGAPFEAVERVLTLMLMLDEYDDVALSIRDDHVIVGWSPCVGGDWDGDEPEVELPQELWDRIDQADFDIVETLPAIERAWAKVYGHAFPVIAVWSASELSEQVEVR
jgi:hypothetical protein